MPYVIAEPCVDVTDQACVEVCPVDCIYKVDKAYEIDGHGDMNGRLLVIHPEECIDCGACEPECPVDAIFEDVDVPDEWKQFTEINAAYFSA